MSFCPFSNVGLIRFGQLLFPIPSDDEQDDKFSNRINSVGMSHNLALLLAGFNGVAYWISTMVPIWTIDR